MVASDFFELAGHHYMVFGCRYSHWVSVYKAKKGTSKELLKILRSYVGTFGTMAELSSDGAAVYVSQEVQEFMKLYGIRHRVSAARNSHSNQAAEGSVKVAKRLIRDNTGVDGSLDTDKFVRALLAHRNTPALDTGVSPAEVVFGRRIKEFLPISPGKLKLNPEWAKTLELRERALARGHVRRGLTLAEHTRQPRGLEVGETVSVQNQEGNHKLRWDKTGTVVERGHFNDYTVRVDGSGRLTCRTRQHLRPVIPYSQGLSLHRRSGSDPGAEEVPVQPQEVPVQGPQEVPVQQQSGPSNITGDGVKRSARLAKKARISYKE